MGTEQSVWLVTKNPPHWPYYGFLCSVFRVECFEKWSQLPLSIPFPSLLVFDLRLEEFESTRFFEQNHFLKTSILFVTQIEELEFVRTCLRVLKSDFMIKPGSERELLTRSQILIAKAEITKTNRFKEEVIIDPIHLIVSFCGKKSLELTKKEFQIFFHLNSLFEEGCKREEIVGRVWSSAAVSEKTVDVHLSNLRRKLTLTGLTVGFDPHRKCYRIMKQSDAI